MKKKENAVPIRFIQLVNHVNTKELLESNIWNLVPQLKRVKIVWKSRSLCHPRCCAFGVVPENAGKKVHVFTRGQYNALQQKKINGSA